MKNLKYTFLLVFVILSCTRFEDPTIGLSNKVELTTSKVTVISSDTALFEGNILKDGNDGITERGFAYHTAAKPKVTNKTTKSGLGIGFFSAKATDLLPNTQYFVAAYAINKSGSVYGTDLSFNTPKSAPRLSPTVIASFTPYSAVITSSITLDGGSPITERGICWSTTAGAKITNNKVVSGSTTNAYDTPIANLNPGSTYYVRSYALNAVGVGYGQEITLKTLDIKLPSTDPNCLPATAITYTEATVNANITNTGLSTKLETGIILSTSSIAADLTYNNAKSQTVKSTLTTSGKISMTFSSLTVGTKYYYVSYAKNEAGTSYSPICSFSTLDYSAPTVDQTCVAASSVGVDVATISGNVTADGGIPTLEKGFIFNTANVNLSYKNSGSQTIISTSTVKGSYSFVISSLKPKTKYYYVAYSKNTKGTTYGPVCDFTTNDYAAPTVNVACITPTDITKTSAKIYGEVTNEGGDVNLEKGFVYGTSSTLTYTKGGTNTLVSSGIGKGAFSFVISNLSTGTTYFYKTYAINTTGNLVYGPLCQFTTVGPDVPVVGATCVTPSAINFTDATLIGNLDSWGTDNYSNSRERGAIWSTSLANISAATPTGTKNTSTWGGSGLGQFQVYMPTLTAGTTYYYRIYAKSSAGTAYGPVCSLVTDSYTLPTFSQTCTSASSILGSSALVSATVTNDGGSVTASGFLYSTSSSSSTLVVTNTNTSMVSASINSNRLAATLTGLNRNTLYYYRAYITGPSGTGYGPICSFTTTNAVVVPTVVTSPATNVVIGSANINGSISSDGGGTITAKGFEWSTGNSFNYNSPAVGYSTTTGTTFSRTLTTPSRQFIVYYRAFATNSAGTGYGIVREFTFP
ncbi:hypothetical protein SKC37_00360 [Aquirufa sp. HETE-83D]|uniref:Fibronectin type-III domain-containing protein n=1 Tax=Aquirufa esocilacus TaxID=3096513 RepID=A0ABW6DEG8_9BACT